MKAKTINMMKMEDLLTLPVMPSSRIVVMRNKCVFIAYVIISWIFWDLRENILNDTVS
jgi:hypothetical protein